MSWHFTQFVLSQWWWA